MLSQTQRQALIEKIGDLPTKLEAVVGDLNEGQLTTPSLEDEWTVAQIVHHMADSHMNSFIRLKLLLTEDQPTLKPYNQERWAEQADVQVVPIQSSLQLLGALHRRWVVLFASLTEAEWQRTAFHPEIGEITPEDLLKIYAAHGEDHIDQIKRVLVALQEG